MHLQTLTGLYGLQDKNTILATKSLNLFPRTRAEFTHCSRYLKRPQENPFSLNHEVLLWTNLFLTELRSRKYFRDIAVARAHNRVFKAVKVLINSIS